MDPEIVDNVLKLVQQLTDSADVHFMSDQSKSLASKILMNLNTNFRRSPIFVAALCSHLSDKGFNLGSLRIDAVMEFQERFGARFARMTAEENQKMALTKKQLATRLT